MHAKKYVVLHTAVTPKLFRRGRVVSADDLGPEVNRMVLRGAVREANDFEATQEQVDLQLKSEIPASFQEQLYKKDQKIAGLEAALSEAQRQLVDAQMMRDVVHPAPHSDEPVAKLMAEKDKTISELQAKLEQMGRAALDKEGSKQRGK